MHPSPQASIRSWLLAPALLAAFLVGPQLAAAEVIKIGTLPGLRFDVSQFSVKPGTDVEIVFSNSDEMLHNFVVTKPGTRMAVVETAMATGAGLADRDFVPDTPNVLWSSKIVPSGASFTLKFTAPTALGEYPYVCTFPGHGILMFGAMIVTNDPRPPVMTPREAAPNAANVAQMMDHSMHMDRAFVQRFFMAQAGPASVAVQLPGGYAYCWDAGAGRFRYAWKGTLGDHPDRTVLKIAGDVYYREEDVGFPVRVGPNPNVEPKTIEFKGYTLDAQGVPEFEQTIDGVTVYERIDIKDGRITRRFRTNGSTLWFAVSAENNERFTATGPKEGAFYKFTGPAAKEFSVTYTPPAK